MNESATPSTSVRKEIKNLHYKYLFSIAYLTPQQEHILLEEEKNLFKHIFENQDKLFSVDTNNELLEFSNYTKTLMENVKDNYIKVFKDKNLNIDMKDMILIENTLNVHFTQLQATLQNQLENHEIFSYLTCVLICTSLLFLIRTTKRALFIFISQQPEKTSFDVFTNLSFVIEYVNSFILSVDNSVKEQKILSIKTKDELLSKTKQVDGLIKQYKECEEEKKQLEQTLKDNKKYNEEQLAILQQNLQSKQQGLEALKSKLQDKIMEIEKEQNTIIEHYESLLRKATIEQDTLKQQLSSCQVDNDRQQNDPEIQKEETKNFKYLFSGMLNLSIKFKEMLQRWENNTLNTELIYNKIKGQIIGLDEKPYKLIQNGLNVLTKIYGDFPISYQNTINVLSNQPTNLKQRFIDVAKLIEGLVILNDKQILKKSEEMKIFYNSEELYKTMLLLYEDLSGAVRAVVRIRDVYAPIISGGNNQKRKINQPSFTNKINKRRKLYLFGGGNEDKRFDYYEIKLDKANKFVNFSGIDSSDKVFQTKTLQHGPFFSVHNNELNNPTSKSVEDDLLNGIGFDSLINIFNGTHEKDKEPAILVYTYGYSGSGKSYTLFGEKTLNTELPQKGVMWEMVRRLQKSYDLKLVNTTICYGYLDYDDNGYVFKTNEAKPHIKNNDNTKEWANIINKEFDDAMKIVNDDSFIKVTPNNPESSRGFYIIKIALYEKGSNYKNIKGYIGVVDMAGNEDPFDIATSICPTMKFEMMDILLKEPAQSHVYDVVYEEIKNVLIDILKPTILKVLTAKQKGYVTDLAKKESGSKVLDNRLDENIQERLVTLRDKLDDTFTIFKKPMQQANYNKTNKKYITITPGSPYTFTYINDKTKTAETLMEVPKVGDVKFHLSAELLQEICIYIKAKYKINTNSVIENNVTINDIREAILLGQQEKASSLKLQYAISKLTDLMKMRKGEIIVTMDIEVKKVYDEIIHDKYNAARSIIQASIIKSMESFNKRPYILPFMINNKLVQYSYTTIARIIKEGYYINKANAELMDYFKKKIHMQDINKIVNVKKKYNFDASFSFTNYNKFTKDFVPMIRSNTNSTQTDFEYDTGLVDIIKKQFPGKNKDIVFACVRNDKDFGKILGAIDTLELIKDLKSS